MTNPKNVLGENLEPCGKDPVTGFFRNSYCDTCDEDFGVHSVCCRVTEEFLKFSKITGNDLSTPRPEFDFPGLKPGDQWCVCASRWKHAFDSGYACPVVLKSTHEATLNIIPLEALKKYAI
ncbi:MAG: DUF2237 domain-containing protein [Ignavibacteriae bacterium HGW-Ignavibacteriae-2]|jgi:hypothetical protein|nr:DUF2237 domain-containing protein [Bacteroidota bacterium]PKL87302.1 MAG: DUF2237 domain-containing protein [Ignavibacteriae bacterium HGW-Ignavibacteriae-2]